MVKFDSLGLDPLILKAVTDTGYDTPTPIQAQAIPAVMSGSDVMAAAQTGTGKTAGFTLPLLHKLAPGRPARDRQVRALVLTPTRELAAQVSESVTTYGKHLKLTNAVVFGGVKANPQISKLRRGVDILIATPGRLLDLYQQGAIDFKQLEVLILDEADRMLDMGFIHDIKKIIAALPYKRQNLMFSATFSKDIRQLAKGLINDPIEISVSPRNTTAETVTQWICPVNKTDKAYALADLIEGGDWQQVLVFSRTKHGANKLATFLEKKGIGAAPIHGNKSQNARTRALADFKAGKIRVLVATDIAARGIDIDQLPHVVNFDLPEVPEDYVHRIGRTGRAGSSGEAVSLVAAEELHLLVDVEKLIGRLIERKFLPGHEPSVPLPEAKLGARVPRPKVSRGGGGGGGRRSGGGGGRGQGGGGGGGRGGRPQGRSSQGGGGGSRRPSSGGGRRSSGGGSGGRSGNR
ncbi:DEAD/DEAH box helicase [Akkermansiaceae bacterium]|nr:DEAD/DEAH box helicase [Akkermansiaceae bacterium]MDB4374698.1 DEAD/DEAH box helicase [bacterium]